MTDIFFVIAILSLLALIVGVIKPKAVKMPNRKMAVLIYLVGFFLFLGLGAELSPDKTGEPIKPQEQTQQNSTQDQATQSNNAPDKAVDEQKQPEELLCKSGYNTAAGAFADLNDYYTDNNSLEIISEEPLRIRLSNVAFPEDHPDVKEMLVKRAIIYGVYRTFIHTSKDKVQVTSYLIDINKNKKLPGSPEYSTTITKKQALDIIKKYIPVQDFSDLIAKDGYGCTFSDDFNKIRFDDKNKDVVFNQFFNDLMSAKK
ncbi:hypothetical protein ISO71_01395 [Morganella morganii subsp. morganii]|uniref:hypothetical protein n=1 Tax=Morganella morganii TaxID=582 RepID=UPI000662A850|nr:hypothetical protein [Morganella morganii]MBT0437086.1 hypothetical protein [Morganella morganii subsp. morganii]MBT0474311.1 hypothetical protein [Morganella morganii subsp. morganii]MBT0502918.1 hypothetical protein [Morganella morganii subsp. morganii]MCW3200408.1 hypothetical protein [Morganella morganii]MCW3202212.1 hypothetical protein [Morganella morganii]